MRIARFLVPSEVQSKVHFAAIQNGCSIPEAYSALLVSYLARLSPDDCAMWVKTTLPLVRETLAAEQLPAPSKESE